MRIEEQLPVNATAPSHARRVARRWLAGALPLDRVEDIAVTISELVTNAVRHAGMRRDETIALSLDYDGDRVRIDVVDAGAGFIPASAMVRGPPAFREGGQGLRLVGAIARRWGVESGPPTRVWCEVPAIARTDQFECWRDETPVQQRSAGGRR
jgi:anti-sigma regulatory factor (Ser/Thr protein kinase)